MARIKIVPRTCPHCGEPFARMSPTCGASACLQKQKVYRNRDRMNLLDQMVREQLCTQCKMPRGATKGTPYPKRCDACNLVSIIEREERRAKAVIERRYQKEMRRRAIEMAEVKIRLEERARSKQLVVPDEEQVEAPDVEI